MHPSSLTKYTAWVWRLIAISWARRPVGSQIFQSCFCCFGILAWGCRRNLRKKIKENFWFDHGSILGFTWCVATRNAGTSWGRRDDDSTTARELAPADQPENERSWSRYGNTLKNVLPWKSKIALSFLTQLNSSTKRVFPVKFSLFILFLSQPTKKPVVIYSWKLLFLKL